MQRVDKAETDSETKWKKTDRKATTQKHAKQTKCGDSKNKQEKCKMENKVNE